MKKLAILSIVALVLITTGCGTLISTSTSNSIGGVQNVELAVKDFEVVGPIRVLLNTKNPLPNDEAIAAITYDKLLKEAYALGADDIVNIRIDYIGTKSTSGSPLGMTSPNVTSNSKTYIVNALAIKYTDAVDSSGIANWQQSTIPSQSL